MKNGRLTNTGATFLHGRNQLKLSYGFLLWIWHAVFNSPQPPPLSWISRSFALSAWSPYRAWHLTVPCYSPRLVPFREMFLCVPLWQTSASPSSMSPPLRNLSFVSFIYDPYTHAQHRTDHNILEFIISIDCLATCPLKLKNLDLFTSSLTVFSTGASELISIQQSHDIEKMKTNSHDTKGVTFF